MKRILVAIDGSQQAMAAARMALEVARATGASVTLAHSVFVSGMVGELPFGVVNEVVSAQVELGRQFLDEARTELAAQNLEVIELQGPPAESIANLAEQGAYDLVVVGSRGHNAVARVLLGSVADRLLHICTRPVLVVR